MLRKLLAMMGCCLPLAAFAETVGFRGHGNGVCEGSTSVPVGFSEQKGVRWKVSLPSIGHASPVCIDGKVLVVCDGGHELQTPTLLCYDADDGRELWRAPIDVIDTLPQHIRDEARRRRAQEWQRLAKWGEQCWRVRKAGNVKKLRGKADPEANAAGYPVALNNPPTAGLIGYRPTTRYGMRPQPADVANYEWLRKHQVWFYGAWWYHYTKVFPTPVTDGKRVWVKTSLDVAACYDLADGAQRWITQLEDDPGKWRREPDPQISSPVLVGDLLIVKRENTGPNSSFIDCDVIGLDAQRGRILWRTTIPRSKYPLSSLLVVTLDGEDHVTDTSGVIVRVKDGKMIKRLEDPFPGKSKRRGHRGLAGIATGAVVGDMLFLPVSDAGGGSRGDTGVRALKLSMGAGGLESEALWGGDYRGASNASIVVFGTKIYARSKSADAHKYAKTPLSELDCTTGKRTARARRDRGAKSIGLIATAGHLVSTGQVRPHRGKGHHGARFTIYAIPGLKKLGEGTLKLAQDGSEDDRWVSLWGGNRKWGNAHPYIYRNRLYIRSNEALYCIDR
jgi:outer membrane protein assembly factor BamB